MSLVSLKLPSCYNEAFLASFSCSGVRPWPGSPRGLALKARVKDQQSGSMARWCYYAALRLHLSRFQPQNYQYKGCNMKSIKLAGISPRKGQMLDFDRPTRSLCLHICFSFSFLNRCLFSLSWLPLPLLLYPTRCRIAPPCQPAQDSFLLNRSFSLPLCFPGFRFFFVCVKGAI